jgi:hypothetical protein
MAGNRKNADLTAPVQLRKRIGLIVRMQIQNRNCSWCTLERGFDPHKDNFENRQTERVKEEDDVYGVIVKCCV